MMSIQMKRLVVFGCGLALLAATAAASSTVTTKVLQAQYMGISLVVDGTPVIPKDSAGKVVEPFAVDGATYLPVRAVGEALGKSVEWDGDSKTVYIGPRPGAGVGLKELPPYQTASWVTVCDGASPLKEFAAAGKTYTVGLKAQLGYGDGNNYALWNLGGNYETLSLKVGHVDGTSERNAVLSFYLDDSADSVRYDVGWEDLPQTITVPLNGAQKLKLVMSPEEDNTLRSPIYGLFDIRFS